LSRSSESGSTREEPVSTGPSDGPADALAQIRRRVRFFGSPSDLRAWFERNHASETELWIGYYKKGAPAKGVTYAEAVEEALCFGGIDGQVRSLDERTYTNRYTPRRRGSRWSQVNLRKARELAATGRMHAAGTAAFSEGGAGRPARYLFEETREDLPEELRRRFRADPAGRARFSRQPTGYRRAAARWVMSARRAETVERRLRALVAASRRGQRIDRMSPGRALDGTHARGPAHSES
jgi:uncharacterized protein YdeI (YjbR/CyaY-like superfamily)